MKTKKVILKNTLQKEIDSARSEIKTDAYAMSIGEWASLYEKKELDIHPEFQRFYRWTSFQKSRFIESIFLGIPIPPIFVAQTKEGIWDVVDGLQRLSTLFEFMGILKDENGKSVTPLVLEGTKYLPALDGKRWEDPEKTNSSLELAQRLYIRREKLDVNIILRESGKTAKYELFQRLNTGGSPLSDQEVRNCIIVMLDREFFTWLRTLADNESFKNCIALSDKALLEQDDMELVLRFIVFRTMSEKDMVGIRDLGDFLTNEMIKLITDKEFNRDKEKRIFERTFKVIFDKLGTDAFHRYDKSKKKHLGGFVISAYEAIAIGLGKNNGVINNEMDLKGKAKDLWSNPVFKSNSGSGKSASTRIPKLIPLGRKIFKK